ncbi:hypothetical protein G7Y89_g2999 [Cudoniella acicularis]|uniref:Polyketide synthase n=1 Tax=Cudoniella acicularis TaxID=354080 RepID=A0A8H4W6F1_9HELO|nr:hypothetical protein G7Y89_g2999 [Cudoniella acicularis]
MEPPASVSILYFGDQTIDLSSSIEKLYLYSKRSPQTARFLQIATDTLQAACHSLPAADRPAFPHRTLRDLCDVLTDTHDDRTVMVPVLLCVSQLGWLLVQIEQEPQVLTGDKQFVNLGVCTGMLPAIAATCITSAAGLLGISPELIRISLRLGLEVRCQSRNLDNSNGIWASVFSDASLDSLQYVIKQFLTKYPTPPCSQIYISARNKSSSTVSGPPRILQAFLKFAETSLPEVRITNIPVYGAYHAGHLYGSDLTTLMGESPILDLPLTPGASIMSTSSGSLMETATTFGECLHNALTDILQKPMDFAKSLEMLASIRGNDRILTIIGPSKISKTLQNSLEPSIYQNFYQSHSNANLAVSPESNDDFAIVENPDLFDARLFNMSPREASSTDPIHRILLMTTYEALEMSGYSPDRTPSTKRDRIGTFVGQASDDWREVNASQNIDTFWTTSGIRPFGPGRLNYHFGWEGPSYSIDTACSSSMAAIHMAINALKVGECDTAIAGGANLMTSSDPYAGLSRGGFLSPTGSCKTWDASADGYCRGEGVGILVIKRLRDAIADKDPIQAVIKGISTNHSADAISITHPHAETQQRLFKTVLQNSNILPEEISYVEMHGTGTQAGDVIETTSITQALATRNQNSHPLYIGTLKPNIGHGEAVSGVASVIKAAMMFQKNIIPLHVGIKDKINPKLPHVSFQALNINIAKENLKFEAIPFGDGKRKIMVNNFNAAGGNTTLILEDYPRLGNNINGHRGNAKSTRKFQIIPVSGKTIKSLNGNSRRLLEFLESNPDVNIADLSYTTTARRLHHLYRKTHVVETVAQAISALQKDLQESDSPPKVKRSPSAIFLFTGQGSLYIGIGHQLLKNCQSFQQSVKNIDEICQRFNFPSVLLPISNPDFDYQNSDPVLSQLVLFTIEVSLAALWKSWGINPSIVCGHSLGEYAALHIAGVLSLCDSIYLIGQRALLIKKHCQRGTHGMQLLKLSYQKLLDILRTERFPSCEIACLSGPETIAVSGTNGDIASLGDYAKEIGIQSTIVQVPFAFHSNQIEPCLAEFENLAQRVQFNAPKTPVASTLLGTIVSEPGVFSASYLTRQARHVVKFSDAIKACTLQSDFDLKSTFWFELGPGSFCLSMVKATLGSSETNILPTISSKEENWLTINKSLGAAYKAGFNVDWSEFHRESEDDLELLPLPRYAFDLKSYWIQYQGDWCLRKGNEKIENSPAQREETFSTTTIQSIESEDITQTRSDFTFLSDLQRPDLKVAVCGHLVNGVPLCPSSVFADMAFTAASYIWSQTESGELPAMDVAEMRVSKPLILESETEKQPVRIRASKIAGSKTISIIFSQPKEHLDGEDTLHAKCVVHFGDGKKWLAEWKKHAYLINDKIAELERKGRDGEIERFQRRIAYKLFSSFVKYDKKFQGMSDICLDTELLEATARVNFQSGASDGTFTNSPYWIDSLGHLSGFILNVSEAEDTVYISQGWESLRITSPLLEVGCYQTYVRMQEMDVRGVVAGDVYVLENSKIIAVFGDVKFSPIQRRLLGTLLPSKSKMDENRSQESQALSLNRRLSAIQVSAPRENSLAAKITACISEQTGVPIVELTDDTDLSDLGLDSLMSLLIAGTLRQNWQVDIPSSIFLEYPTLGELLQHLQKLLASDESKATTTTTSTTSILTPATPEPRTPKEPPTMTGDLAKTMKSIIIAESGLHPTKSSPKQHSQSELDDAFPKFASKNNPDKISNSEGVLQSPVCTSVLLQGNPDSKAPALFLLPDGSGSAGSYIGLPALGNAEMRVFGVNSPYLRCPEEFTVSLEVVVEKYVAEILRLDSEGPYLLGGWSIGGIYAYEAAQILRRKNKIVKGLFFIDAPCPGTIPPLPHETITLLDRLGIFDTGKNTQKMQQHFKSSISALKTYHATPMIKDRQSIPPPKCLVLWARHGVWESVSKEERELLMGGIDVEEDKAQKWMMHPREKCGGNGWEELLLGIDVEVLDGNHFSLLKDPQIRSVGEVGRPASSNNIYDIPFLCAALSAANIPASSRNANVVSA